MANEIDITVSATEDASSTIENVGSAARRTEVVVVGAMGSTEEAFDTAARGAGRFGQAMDTTAGGVGTAGDAVEGFGQVTQSVSDIMNYAEKKADDLARAQIDVEQAAQDGAQAIEDMEQAARDASQAEQDLEQAGVDLAQALLDQKMAQDEYNKAVKEHGKNSDEAKQASIDLRQANLDAFQAEEDKAQAIRDSSQAALDAKQAMIDQKAAANDLSTANRELETQSSVLVKISEWAGMLGGVLGGLVGIIGAVAAIQWVWNAAMTANPIGLVVVAIGALIAIIVVIATKTDWFQRLWKSVWVGIIQPVRKAWDWLYANTGKLFSWINSKVTNMMVALRNQFAKVKDIIYAPFRAAFNAVAGAWNGTVGGFGFSVPGWVPGMGGNSFRIPSMPRLAVGGDVLKAGLAMLHAGERVVPTAGVQRLKTGQAAEPSMMYRQDMPKAELVVTFDSVMTDSKFMNLVHENIRAYVKSQGRGNVQVAYGQGGR